MRAEAARLRGEAGISDGRGVYIMLLRRVRRTRKQRLKLQRWQRPQL